MSEREQVKELVQAALWLPQPGPQLEAFQSKADSTLYGGGAGGGKSDLAIGLALTRHKRTLFIRREGTQLLPVIDRVTEILGTKNGWNGADRVWRLPGGRVLQLGGVPSPGDEAKYQGSPRDLLVIDEAAEVLEDQVRFLLGWLRTTDPKQRCRALFCSNPPMSAEGEYLIRWWAPWLDPAYPKPAKPGELRWVAMIPGEGERWVDGPEPFTHRGEVIRPISRTFIPSLVGHNRYLATGDYARQLAALPEPRRSQLLKGDFTVGRSDDDWQVIPSTWIRAAMDRWTEGAPAGDVTSVGVDPSRGGDESTIAIRRGWRFDELVAVKPDAAGVTGGAIAKRVLDVAGPVAPVHIDIIGIGASAYDHIEAFIGRRAVPVNGAAATNEKDFSGRLGFANVRAFAWWRMREALAPERAAKVSLPRDQRLFADLAAPRYRLTTRGIQVEDKGDIKRRLGRSPDRGDAVVLAGMRTAMVFDRSGREITVHRAFDGWLT